MKIQLLLALICTTVLTIRMHQAQRYYTNLSVQNFIIGGVGGQRIYFTQLVRSPNVAKCPFHKPFTTDGKTCFQCTIDLPIFNLQNQRCQNCATGIKGLKDHNCV